MLGLSYGELFLILGATAALVGPKDLPRIARVAGRVAGPSIGYIQLARGQYDNIVDQSQARQVTKELQDAMAQFEAIKHQIPRFGFGNPGHLTSRIVDHVSQTTVTTEELLTTVISKPFKDHKTTTSGSSDMHSQATAYAKLAESTALNSESESSELLNGLTDESGLTVLPVSAESAGLLPKRRDNAKGFDIVFEAILEADVARNAKEFFAQPQNQIKSE